MRLAPWQVWWIDFDPTEGHEQGKRRPAVIVSSATHLRITGSSLLTVAPLTSVERPTWLHRIPVQVGSRTGYVITDQLRTLAASRLSGTRPAAVLSVSEIAAVRAALSRMVDW